MTESWKKFRIQALTQDRDTIINSRLRSNLFSPLQRLTVDRTQLLKVEVEERRLVRVADVKSSVCLLTL